MYFHQATPKHTTIFRLYDAFRGRIYVLFYYCSQMRPSEFRSRCRGLEISWNPIFEVLK
jgi:hypothetical protein